MPDELLTESPEDKALLESIRTESTPPETPSETPAETPSETPVKPAEATAPPPAPEPKRPETHVPLATFLEEREARKRFERELAEARKPPPTPEIDETQDPIGAIAEVRRQNAEFKEFLRQQQEDIQYGQRAQAAVNEYRAKDSSYDDAAQFLQQARTRQIQALPNVPPENVAAMVVAEAKHLFKTLMDAGVNPAEGIIAQAKAIGWQPRAAAAPAAAPAAPAAPAPAPAPAPQPAPDTQAADERIARLERGQRAAGTSSGSGGRATGANDLSIQDIVNLDGAAFDSATAAFFKREKAAGNWS